MGQPWISLLPLLLGLGLPLATFLCVQSVTVQGWWASHSSLNLCQPPQSLKYYQHPLIQTLLALSLVSGSIASLALYLRMLLEQKIKAMHRCMLFGALGQALFGLLALVTFSLVSPNAPRNVVMTDGPLYAVLSCLSSIAVAALQWVQQARNTRSRHYGYTLLDLSSYQRQLVILTMSSLMYTVFMASVFSGVEGWSFHDALYWSVTTLTTIGFGDLSPKTVIGRVLIPPMAFTGIGLTGGNIWCVRQVMLELLTHRLAAQYSKKFTQPEEELGVPVPAETLLEAQRRRSGDYLVVPKRSLSPTRLDADVVGDGSIESISEHVDVLSRSSSRLSRTMTTSDLEPYSSRQKTLIISRSRYLPELRIIGGSDLRRRQIMETTRRTFKIQILAATFIELTNLLIFGSLFAHLEGWSFLDGIYFATTSLLTIGMSLLFSFFFIKKISMF